MGQTAKLLCLSWLFIVLSPISTKKLSNQPSLIDTELKENDEVKDNLVDSDQLFEPLNQVHRSIAKPTKTPSSSTSSQAALNEIFKAYNFLKQYHYISNSPYGNRDIKTAVETYQRFIHLPVTGKLDNTTLKQMARKRCGVPDVEIFDTSFGRRRKRFAVQRKKWTTTTLLYAFETFTGDLSTKDQKKIIAKAFKMWSDVSPLVFTLTTDLKKANIKIRFGTLTHGTCKKPFDGKGSVLAHAFYPIDGRLHFDDAEDFTDGTYSGTNLLAVAVHEIGHTLGLAHSSDQNSVMYPYAQRYAPNFALGNDDKNAIKYLYAGGTSTPGSSVCQDVWQACASLTTKCKVYQKVMKSMCKRTCNFCV